MRELTCRTYYPSDTRRRPCGARRQLTGFRAGIAWNGELHVTRIVPVCIRVGRGAGPARDRTAEQTYNERPLEAPQNRMPYATFDEVYRNAPVKVSKMSYSILKVAEMSDSPHLTAMSGESKRSSILMALEAAGVTIDDILQHAMVRQRALNDYEEGCAAQAQGTRGRQAVGAPSYPGGTPPESRPNTSAGFRSTWTNWPGSRIPSGYGKRKSRKRCGASAKRPPFAFRRASLQKAIAWRWFWSG